MYVSSHPLLAVENLHASVDGTEILRGLNLVINPGEVHAIMGPNGSGKSTLSNTLMGHPHYKITQGTILYKGQAIQDMSADERARLGLFLALQYPTAIPGVSLGNFLLAAVRSVRGNDSVKPLEFRKELMARMKELGIKPDFVKRYVNDGFSGGEKKRVEILQMSLLKPSLAILDETDSGLDIDALKVVSEGVNRQLSPEVSALVITHYQRLLDYIKPQFIHVLVNGRIVKSGGPELAVQLEASGYDELLREFGPSAE